MISVVTITFNNFEELVETLDSIKGLSNIESIVINGGSCEKTRSFLNNYSGISVSEKDNGISDAFNKGLALASGDAVMYLNSGDMLIEKDYLNWANDVFTNELGIDFTFSGIKIKDEHVGIIEVSAENAESRSMAKGMPYPHQTLIIRRKIFEQIGNFKISLRFVMDFDLVLRMNKLGCKGKHYDKMTVLMDGSGVSSKHDVKVFFENFKVLRLNHQLSFSILIRLLVSLLLIFLKKTLRFFNLSGLIHFLKKNRHKIRY